VVGGVLAVMVSAACWIWLRPLRTRSVRLYRSALLAIVLGGTPILFLVTGLVWAGLSAA
jgi:hypothetical protein